VFTIVIRDSLGEYRSQALVFVSSKSTKLDLLGFDFDKISFAYGTSHFFSFECFACYNVYENITPEELIKVLKDHEN